MTSAALFVSLSHCTLDVARADALALVRLSQKTARWAESLPGCWGGTGVRSSVAVAPTQPTPALASQHPPFEAVVCHCTTTVAATFHGERRPLVRVTVVDAIALFRSGAAGSVALRGVELACTNEDHGANGQHFWRSVVERAPRVRAKPAEVVNQDMASLWFDEQSYNLRVASAILRLAPGFAWAGEVVDTWHALTTAPQGVGPPAVPTAAPSRRVVVATAEDILIDGPEPRSAFVLEQAAVGAGAAWGAQAVVEIVRVSLSTVVLVPAPPLQHFSVTADQIRVLFAKHSLPYSATSEHNFLELASLSRERALSVHVSTAATPSSSASSAEATPAALEVDVGISDMAVSFCADTLSSLLDYAADRSGVSEVPSNERGASRENTARTQSSTSSMKAGGDVERALSSPGGEEQSRDQCIGTPLLGGLPIGEPFDLLPCIEDYFNPLPVEGRTHDAEIGFNKRMDPSSSSSSRVDGGSAAASLAPQSHGTAEVSGDGDEWVVDGFYDCAGASELGKWRGPQSDGRESPPSEEDGAVFPIGDMQKACWFDAGDGEARGVDVKPHYVPLPSRERCRLESRLGGRLLLDLHLAVVSASVRLFDGSDWEDKARETEGKAETFVARSSTTRVETRKPANSMLMSSVDQSYFDGSGRGAGGGKLPGRKRGSRKTERVVTFALKDAQVRYNAKQADESVGGPTRYLRCVGDVVVKQSLNGGAQNCLYEWKTLRQAREEVDERGAPVKMISVEMFGFLNSLGQTEEFSADIRVRPLRVAATWDLVDFLRSFSQPPTQEKEAATKREAPLTGAADPSELKSSPPPGVRLLSASIHAARLKIDFDTRLVNFEAVQRGDMLELLKLFPLSGVELELQPVLLPPAGRGGVPLPAFLAQALESWVRDITSSQLHHFVAGAGVLRPFTTVGKTAANVILLPLEQYRQKNGRVVFALRRGALEFVKTVTVESLTATVALTRILASSLSFLADSNPPSSAEQPGGLEAGVARAQSSLYRGVSAASHAIIAVPLDNYHRNGTKGALKTTVRAVPVAVLAPVIGATEAISFTLMGIRNTMDPEKRHDDESKYRHSWK